MITAVSVQLMPERVAVHFGLSGEADRYGSRYESFILPLIIIILAAVWELVSRAFEKRAEQSDDGREKSHSRSNARVADIIALSVTAMMTLMQIVFLFRWVKGVEYADLDELRVMSALMGILFIVLGNVMPKTKPNGSIGLRVKWSMYNDVTWQKSNTLAGIMLMAAGVLSFVTALVASAAVSVVMLLVYLAAAVTVSCIYAKKVYDSEKDRPSKNTP